MTLPSSPDPPDAPVGPAENPNTPDGRVNPAASGYADSPRAPATAVVGAVEAGLAEHLIDLLAAAGVVAVDRQQSDGLTAIVVRATDLEHARGVLGLLFPRLLAQDSGDSLPENRSGRLSDRLLRRQDWTGPPPAGPTSLVDGRSAFEALAPGGPEQPFDPALEDDYTPPEPPPLPRGDLVSRFAWLGAAGGPLLMVIAFLLDLPSVVAAVALAGFVSGFGVLVARMPDRARPDDGWDDGAVL